MDESSVFHIAKLFPFAAIAALCVWRGAGFDDRVLPEVKVVYGVLGTTAAGMTVTPFMPHWMIFVCVVSFACSVCGYFWLDRELWMGSMPPDHLMKKQYRHPWMERRELKRRESDRVMDPENGRYQRRFVAQP